MRSLRLIAAAVLVASTLGVHAQTKDEPRAFLLFEIEPRSSALLSAVNATGAVAVGNFNGGGGFYWMPTTGVIATGGLFASSVSSDGRTIVGSALDARNLQNAAIWQRSVEWRLLGGFPDGAACGPELSRASGVSRDGKVIVGWANRGCQAVHAFRWEESGGMADLGSTVAGRSSQAFAISGDGKVIVGRQTLADGTDAGVRWTDGKQETFAGPEGNVVGSAYAVNLNGGVIVGRQCRPGTPAGNQSGWIWTAKDGVKCLPPPALQGPSGTLTYANGVSDHGRVVVGTQSFGQADSEAVIWIDKQPFYLKDYLRAHGVPGAFERWINTGELTGISPDGRILVGWGAAVGGFRGYVVILEKMEILP